MKIKFYQVAELDKNMKATIQRTGKLGFTREAAKKLKLETKRSADIGFNEDDETDKSLYLAVYESDKGNFKVIRAGSYFYLNTKVLFDNLKINYLQGNIVFDMAAEDLGDQIVYVLKRRAAKKGKEDIETNK